MDPKAKQVPPLSPLQIRKTHQAVKMWATASARGVCSKTKYHHSLLFDSFFMFGSTSVRWFGKQSRSKKERKNNRPKLVNKIPPFEPSLAIQKEGGQWYLPAGTMVKHGTTTNNLRSILEKGILPGHKAMGRSKLRSQMETSPEVRGGIYVASCYLAYRSSIFNFTASLGAINASIKIPDTDRTNHSGDKDEMHNCKLEIARSVLVDIDDTALRDFGLPIVVNIKLQEDVPIFSDEDYLEKSQEAPESVLRQAAGFVWETYGSCALLMDKISPDWIDTIEHTEIGFRLPWYEEMLYYASEGVVVELAKSVVTKRIKQTEQKFDKHRTNPRMRIDHDVRQFMLATSLRLSSSIDPRLRWHKQLAGSDGKKNLSNVIFPDDVDSFLLEIEEGGKRPLLASGFTLHELCKDAGLSNAGKKSHLVSFVNAFYTSLAMASLIDPSHR